MARALPLVLALLWVGCGPVDNSGQDGGTGALEGYQVFPDQSLWTHLSSVAIDPNGGIHIAYTTILSGPNGYPMRYAYCAGSCHLKAAWSVVELNDSPTGLHRPSVRLDSSGKPRVLWFEETSQAYFYSACESDCTKVANWTHTQLFNSTVGPEGEGYFVVDTQGRPSFVHRTQSTTRSGLYFTTCASGQCTQKGGWSEVKLPFGNSARNLSLDADAQNRLRLAYREDNAVFYAQCEASCDNASSWQTVRLFDAGSGTHLQLKTGKGGEPRVLYYTGELANADTKNRLFYASCNSGCTAAGAWTNASLGLPNSHGAQGLALAVDGSDRPRAVYQVDEAPYALRYSSCKEGCNTASAKWVHGLVEDGPMLDKNESIQAIGGCTSSHWRSGERPAMALDANGNPRVAYEARHYQTGSCQESIDATYVRLAGFYDL